MTSPAERLTAALSDRYRIERELGQGGMATVYLADDIKHGRKVAVKVVHPELSAVLGAERFLSEIHVTAALQHPHILPLFDSGQAEGQLFYVMPFVDGESLRGRLNRERQLPIDEAVRFTREVASALDYAHRHGVVHRDIKPENILIHDGQAVVADFGIALAVSHAGGGRLTQTGLSLGTPQYMSPEQATGEREIDARSDIYSLGAVTYEALTGEPPFTGPSAQAIVAKVITTEPRPLATQRKSIPPHVEAAVLKSLEKMPADRFATAAEFARALGDATFSAPTVAATSARSAARRTTLRWREIAIGALALSLVLAMVTGWQLLSPEPVRAVNRFSVHLDQNAISQSTDAPAISPDGKYMVYSNDEGQLMLRDRSRLHAVAIPGTDNGWAPFFSPDGKTMAFFTGFPGALKTVPIAGGPATTLLADSTYGNGGTWSDDGWLYFSRSSAGSLSLMRVRPEGGKAELVARPDTTRDELFFYWPEALPGGKTVLVGVWRRKGAPDIGAVDVKSGAVRVLTRGVRALYASSGHLVVLQTDGSLTGAGFDPKTLEVDGEATQIVTGIHFSGPGKAPIALSREGTLLYEAYEPVNQVVRVGRDGTAKPVDPAWTGRFSHLAVSPDGSQLAVTVSMGSRAELWVKVLDAGTLTRLSGEGTYSYRPTWSPDGRSVLFVSDRNGRSALYRMAADGSAPSELVAAEPRGVDEGVSSRDGQSFLLRVGSGGGRDIFVKAGETASRALVAGDAEEYSPALSPDGRWLAYGSDESGRSQVYVRPFPDASRGRWQISRVGGTEPVWSPGGGELFYRNATGNLVSVEVGGGSDFRVTSERTLFSARDYTSDTRSRAYSVAPDGKSFYFISTQPGNPSQMVVVLNWLEELKAKVGR
ncbi:MAG TPA: LpqB family beta-propeller domain-containing protein [Gemmatimonadaceae bacterium]|nr:LpqB family beta-propeller domain-containing protein [Gemmatimonadaceae bacterium]